LNKEISKKFEITNSNHIIIECKVNGINCRSIIDTGASNSCINYFSASKFNIDFKKHNEKAASATEAINEIFYSNNNILEIDDFKKNDFEIILFDMSYINNSFREKEIEEVDGIIGGDILNELNVNIDYKKKSFNLKL
tara:strand:- start:1036 stop:1449 length:414 start_codon:yes stop_codon:yes gene_type:complete